MMSDKPAAALAVAKKAKTDSMRIIDCDMHHYWPSNDVLMSYLAPEWHAYHTSIGSRTHQATLFPGAPYPRTAGAGKRQDARPPSGLPVGSDFDFFLSHHLNALPIEYGILNSVTAVGAQLNSEYDAALARAINTWTHEKWLMADGRLRASLAIPYEDAELSVEEIEHWAGEKTFVQVYLRPRTLQPIGNRKYWKIFEAAERHGLTVCMHFGGVSGTSISTSGWPSYYLEEHTMMAQAFQSHLISLVCEGVFDRFPGLKLVLMEGGFAWLPPLMWRMDKLWKRLGHEMPHVKRLPSDIVRSHVRMTTQPMEEPHRPEDLLKVIEHIESDEVLMFATDYPHWDFDHPARAFQTRLPKALMQKILYGNAARLWGFPEPATQ